MALYLIKLNIKQIILENISWFCQPNDVSTPSQQELFHHCARFMFFCFLLSTIVFWHVQNIYFIEYISPFWSSYYIYTQFLWDEVVFCDGKDEPLSFRKQVRQKVPHKKNVSGKNWFG